MRITIYGCGYVGLVTAACFAELGNDVVCVDKDEARVALLLKGECPIHEPGLPEMIANNFQAGRLFFTTDAECGVTHGDYQFISVGTPATSDGSADLRYVFEVAETIGKHINAYRLVVNKSTVPVGTAEAVDKIIRQALGKRNLHVNFDVASNPEFLRQGAAIGDFLNSDRIIIGTNNDNAAKYLQVLYSPFNRNHDRLIAMDIRSAELTKYAANAMLATKISFMNEMSNIAERVGADIENVRIGIGSDPRIGYPFINPGCGFGGSCFPKDVDALERTASQHGYDAQFMKAIKHVNENQKQILFKKMLQHFKGDLSNKVIALWGLAFKPQTNDMREAPSRTLMEDLWKVGAKVQAFDPVAISEARRIYGDRADLMYCQDPEAALLNADALVVVTEWKVFSSPDFAMIKSTLKEPVIFDGRNLYDPTYVKNLGLHYYGIGRGIPLNSEFSETYSKED
ncbi:UDP-glucose/GDP-mannose dehydrogenase family protein [soil metagenome]